MSHYDDDWAEDHGYVSCKCPECGHTFKTDSHPECPRCGYSATSAPELFTCADCDEDFTETQIVDLLDMSEEIGRNLCNDGEQGSIYCCLRCALGRTKKGVVLTMRPTEQKEIA